eukprot:1147753-Pelagomonas_calceolata.AAC.3
MITTIRLGCSVETCIIQKSSRAPKHLRSWEPCTAMQCTDKNAQLPMPVTSFGVMVKRRVRGANAISRNLFARLSARICGHLFRPAAWSGDTPFIVINHLGRLEAVSMVLQKGSASQGSRVYMSSCIKRPLKNGGGSRDSGLIICLQTDAVPLNMLETEELELQRESA